MRAILRSICLGLALIALNDCASTGDGDDVSIPFLDGLFKKLGDLNSNGDELDQHAHDVLGIRSEDQLRAGTN